jgi:hypothetical protein
MRFFYRYWQAQLTQTITLSSRPIANWRRMVSFKIRGKTTQLFTCLLIMVFVQEVYIKVIVSLLAYAAIISLMKAWVWQRALHDDAYVKRFNALKKGIEKPARSGL